MTTLKQAFLLNESQSNKMTQLVFNLNVSTVFKQVKEMAGKVLVTGGGGYIGSHCVVELIEAGYCPVVIDNFYNCIRGEFQSTNMCNICLNSCRQI